MSSIFISYPFSSNRYVPASSHDASGHVALHVPHRGHRISAPGFCAAGPAADAPALALPLPPHDQPPGSAAGGHDERDGKYTRRRFESLFDLTNPLSYLCCRRAGDPSTHERSTTTRSKRTHPRASPFSCSCWRTTNRSFVLSSPCGQARRRRRRRHQQPL